MPENITPHSPLDGDRPELTVNLQSGGMEEQVSIVVVHKDRPEYLNMTLQSIAVTSFNNNYEIIVSDNASGKDSQDFLDEIKDDVKVVRNERNLFWSAAANRGFAAADKHSKYIVFLHHDIVITNPSWLDLLINVAESQGSGMVGTELGSYMVQGNKVDFIQDHMILFTRECFEKLGMWPEKLPQIAHSFILTIAAQQQGFKPQVMRNPICHHYKIFSLDINEFERLSESALVCLPTMLHEIQSIPVVAKI